MVKLRWMLSSKIHRATVTGADLSYVGSITIDRDLMDAAGLVEWEGVHVLDITNGNRLETYVIEGPRGSGEICINGAAAHLINPCLLYTSPSPRDLVISRMPSSA